MYANNLVVVLTLLALKVNVRARRARNVKCGWSKLSMTRKRYNYRLQANPRHREVNTDH